MCTIELYQHIKNFNLHTKCGRVGISVLHFNQSVKKISNSIMC